MNFTQRQWQEHQKPKKVSFQNMSDSECKQYFVGNTTANMSFIERDKDCIPVMTPSRKPDNTPGPKEMFNTRSNYYDQYSSQLHNSLASGKNLLKKSTEQA